MDPRVFLELSLFDFVAILNRIFSNQLYFHLVIKIGLLCINSHGCFPAISPNYFSAEAPSKPLLNIPFKLKKTCKTCTNINNHIQSFKHFTCRNFARKLYNFGVQFNVQVNTELHDILYFSIVIFITILLLYLFCLLALSTAIHTYRQHICAQISLLAK